MFKVKNKNTERELIRIYLLKLHNTTKYLLKTWWILKYIKLNKHFTC